MICKRMLRTATYTLAGLGGTISLLAAPTVTRADDVTPVGALSQANRLSTFHDYSINAVGLTSSIMPGSPGGGLLTTVLGKWASTDTSGSGRSYEISFTPVVGYDSDPEAHHVTKGGVFGGGDLAAVYNINIGPDDANIGSPTEIQFGYDATGAVYEGGVFNADVFQQTIFGTYRRSLFQDSLFLGFLLDDQFTTEYGNAFLNTFDVSPSLEWFMLSQFSADVSYNFTRLDFFIRSQQKRNPDAERHTVNVKAHFYPTPQVRGEVPESADQVGDFLRQALTRATFGYAFVDNESSGSDYIYNANRLSIGLEGLRIPRVQDVTMDVMYAHEWQNYMVPSVEGPEVIAGKPAQRRRKDHMDILTLRGNARLLDLPRDRGTLSSFIQWDIIADRSNIIVRDYNEFIISGGLNYHY